MSKRKKRTRVLSTRAAVRIVSKQGVDTIRPEDKKNEKAKADNDCCVCFSPITGKAGKLPCGHDKLCVDCIIKVFTTMDVKCPICRWVPPVHAAKHWSMVTTGRLWTKGFCDSPEKLKWVSDGVKHFDCDVPDTPFTGGIPTGVFLCMRLSEQLHYETDDDDDA